MGAVRHGELTQRLRKHQMSLKGKKVLVTGATGFIGSRLVQWLQEVEGAEVVALVRRFQNASRIARFGIDMRRGDVTDIASLRAASAGCSRLVRGGERRDVGDV